MEITLDKLKLKTTEEKPCQVKLTVQIPFEIVDAKQKEVREDFRRVAQLPGFRAGKAPMELIEEKFSDKIKSEVLEQLLRDSVPTILKEKSLIPISRPVVDSVQYDGKSSLSFNLIVERSPQFKVKNFTQIPVVKKIKKVKDQDVTAELEQLRERNAQMVPSKSEKVEKNHFVIVDYQCFLNEQPLPSMKAENQLIHLDASQSIEGLTDGMIGLTVGETREIPVRFPKEYPQKNLADKEVIFKITLRAIKEKNLPNLDDEFAKDFGLSSLDELKTKIRESLDHALEKSINLDMEKQIHDHLIQENLIPVPDSIVAAQLEHLIQRTLSMIKVKEEEVEQTKAALREKHRVTAERQVRLSYLLAGISKQENLEATEEEFKTEIEKLQKSQPEKSEEIMKYFQEHQSAILDQITDEKVMKFLIGNAKIKEVDES